MKRIFTLISAMLITVLLFAQSDELARKGIYNQSRLSISTAANNPVRVLLDGTSYNNSGYDNDILVSDIKPGYHRIKVYLQNERYGNRKRINKNMQLVYEATMYIKPQYHVDISINRFGRAFVDERQINSAYYTEYDETENSDWGNDNNYMQPMDAHSFEQFREMLKKENFDNTRAVLAKQTIAANYFSAAQVKEIVQLFSFENTKLEMAKYCYKYTTDKNNYFLLNDAFSFSSNKENLARYIQAYR